MVCSIIAVDGVVVLLKSYFLQVEVFLFPEITQNTVSHVKIVKISLLKINYYII